MTDLTLLKVIHIIIYPLIAFFTGIIFIGIFRKFTARIHRRYGPPLFQPLIDIIRFFSQRSISHGAVFSFGVILALSSSLTVLMFIPFGNICPMCNDGGLLVVLYLMLFAPLGIALSGGESANPNTSIGIARKLMISLSYEIPFLMIILAVMGYYNTTSLADIVKLQQKSGWAILNFPLVIPGIAYLFILPVMMGIRPFDIPSAPQEIASGPIVEYGGKILGIYHIEHAVHLFIGLALYVDLFLGGGENIVFFLIKTFILFFIAILINAIYPRYRIDQAFKYIWRWPTALALIGLLLVRLPLNI